MAKQISEIIIEMNEKNDKILQNLVNQDLLLKTIVKKLNKILETINKENFSENISDNLNKEISKITEEIKAIPPTLSPTHARADEFKQESKTEVTSPQPNNDPSVVRIPGMKEGIFLHKTNNLKDNNRPSQYAVPVQQKLVYSDGSPITMANVELLSEESGSLVSVKKLKTNATGKWTTNVQPGKYIIKVFKNKNIHRNEVKHLANITIPEEKSGTQLEDLVI